MEGSKTMKSCVLAYSGGLDTSVLVGWLMDEGFEVHCVYVDVGQPCEDRQAIIEKALKIAVIIVSALVAVAEAAGSDTDKSKDD